MSFVASDCSIVIPLYNRAAMVAGCLDSLLPAIGAGMEVIVVDDGSADDGAKAVQDWITAHNAQDAVQCLIQANAGPGAARNTGVAASDRAWIVFFDSDDLWLPWSAQTILDALDQFPSVQALFFATQPFGAQDDPVGTWTAAPQDIALCADFFEMRATVRDGLVGSGYFAIRRQVINDLDGFEPHIRGGEDMDLFFRIPGAVARLHAPVIVAAREDNSDSLTRSFDAVIEGLEFTLLQLQSGAYPHPASAAAVADGVGFWLHVLCNEHHGKAAYRLLYKHGGLRLLLKQGRFKQVVRLILHPLLAVIRPKNYSFGWTPAP